MAAPTKKRAVKNEMKNLESGGDNGETFNSDDEDNNSSNADQETEKMDTEEIQVDFEARNLEDSDFHGIKRLLQQLFLKANINLSELTDTMISQNYVGSAIKQIYIPEDGEDDSDEDDVLETFGIITVVNMTERKKLDCIQQLKSYLIDRCTECSQAQKNAFQQLLSDSDKQVGFLLNERFINIPPQIALPSFESLWNEVENAKKKKMKYDFTEFIMICKTLKMPDIADQNKGKGSKNIGGQRIFTNAEEEYFFEEAKVTFDFSVKSERDTAVGGQWGADEDDMEPFRTVLVIEADKMPVIMAKLADNLQVQ